MGYLEQRRARHRAVGETESFGLTTVDDLAEHDRRHRHLRASDAPQHPGVATAGVDSQLQEPGVEPSFVGDDPHIASEREVHPCTDRGSVDRRQRGQRAAGDAQEPLVDAPQALIRRLREVAEIRPGTERRRGAGDHDGADRAVGLERVHRGDDLDDHLHRQGVALVGIIEGQGADAVGGLGEYECHRASVAPPLATDSFSATES